MSEYLAKLKPEEIVKMDVDSIYIGNLNTVAEDSSLPLHGKSECQIESKSSVRRVQRGA